MHLGYFGPLVMGIMDSSFLFLPFGNDLLVVVLSARNHHGYLIYVLAAVCGSTLGVFLLDLMSRKLGEEGVQKVAGQKRFENLKRKIGQRGFIAILVGCLAPPPFPFTIVIAVLCALGYPRLRLLLGVALSRAIRFLILGLLAMKFGRMILQIINSTPFKWTMIGFTVLCIIGSVFSLRKWFKRGGRKGQPAQAVA
jgi:membrane protein YqaA with SNARE-associated domain